MLFNLERDPKKEIAEYSKIIDDQLYISTKDWDDLLYYFSESEIKEHLSKEIKKIPFPLRRYTKSKVRKDFSNLILSKIVLTYSDWENPRLVQGIENTYKGQRILLFGNNRGKTVSDQFTQLERMKCGYKSCKSPIERTKQALPPVQ